MNWNNLHLIQGKNIYLAYCYPANSLSLIDKSVYHALLALKEGIAVQKVLEMSREKENLSLFIQSLYRSLNIDNTIRNDNKIKRRKVIKRITLHVANDCNLRCKYCYAGGGDYGQVRNLMTRQTAENFVDFCIREFDQVEKIVFFGGEPILNIEVMELVCSRFKMYKEKGKLSMLPVFIIITNGTILTPAVLQFVKNNISFITVSIDGPEDINDINRVYRNGKGSYKKISQFIHTILQETKVKISYEATFTQSHIDAHYTHDDITKALKNEFGINGSIVNEKTLCLKSQNLLDYWDSVDRKYLIDTNFEYLPRDFWAVLHSITNRKKNDFCPIIDTRFAVGADGDIFACQMLNGIRECRLGNINGTNVYNSPELYKPFDVDVNFKDNDKCKLCWAQKLCGGCTVQRFFDDKANRFLSEPDQCACELTLQCIDRMLLTIALIRKDKELWTALLEKKRNK